LVELFDQHNVSFVSVTQSFNTTSSMGRLTLNVLLSFAQFEREVIGERVRDKISASKRKGLWVGGPVALGYVCNDKKISVDPIEAESVRGIFRRYLELGSVGALVADLDRQNVRTKKRRRTDGRIIGGIRFGVGSLAHLLKNRFYIGEVAYRGEIHRGEQEPVLDRELFEAVQAKLASNAVERQIKLRGAPAILNGRLFDDQGNRMSPTHTNKRGVRYRYYVSHAILQNEKHKAGGLARIPAPELEIRVVESVRNHLQSAGNPEQPVGALLDRDLVEQHIELIVVKPGSLEVYLNADETPEGSNRDKRAKSNRGDTARRPDLVVPWVASSSTAVKGVVHTPAISKTLKAETRDALLTAIAKARAWVDELGEGRTASFADIATREGKVERHIRLLVPLAFVSPRIISAIADGTAPADLTVTGLAKALPFSWAEQEQKIGIRAT
jgi:hypothetical protein